MHFRSERTISRKVLVRYSMALPFPLLHLGMERVHVVQVVVFVVALPGYKFLRSASLLFDQPVVAVGAVCLEECSAAEMGAMFSTSSCEGFPMLCISAKAAPSLDTPVREQMSSPLIPSSLPESLSSWVLHSTISFPCGTCGSISRPVRFCPKA